MPAQRLAFAFIALAGCADPSDPPEIRSDLDRDLQPDVSDDELAALVAGNTQLAADLYGAVRGEPGNLFFSPHSISTALAMTYAGANGATESEMAATLHFTLPEPDLHEAQNRLDLELASRAEDGSSDTRPFRLNTASSIWGQVGYEFLPAYLDTLAVHYGAGLHVLDFAADPDGSRETINAWVEDRTEDKIQDLLPAGSISDATRLVLTNAIYFTASWQTPFDHDDTATGTFTTPTGDVEVDTMHEVAELGYGEGEGYRVVELPYDGGKVSMVIVVPDDLDAFETSLTADTIAAVHDAIGGHSVTLSLPKFSFDAPLSLGDTLVALGMPSAFGDADFSGIDGTRRLVISDVLHKGFVGIDEEGTEAAAATAVVLDDTAVPEPAAIDVDRPFVFWIRDRPTGAVLFLGRVVDPT